MNLATLVVRSSTDILNCVVENSDVVGFTIAEYLPFDEHKLNKLFSKIEMFTK